MGLHVLICGGGALAHVFAGIIGALEDVRVTVLSRRPREWSHTILVHYADMAVVGRATVTDNPMVAGKAALILIAAPAYAHAAILRRILRHLQPGTWIGAFPAIGGFDLLVRDLTRTPIKLLGSLRSPYNARVIQYGNEVLVSGIVPCLDLVVGRGAPQQEAVALVDRALGLKSRIVQPFLLATLSPAGTIFHAARLFELISEPDASRQGFYVGWGVGAGRAYLAMDAELTALRRILGCDEQGIDAAGHYGIADSNGLAMRIRAMRGLPEIEVPIRNGGLDLDHRFLREDLPYGLCLIQQIASKVGLPCPSIAAVLQTIAAAAGSLANELVTLPPHLSSLSSEDWKVEARA